MHISPKKLLHAKWTAVNPVNREKHFLVTRLIVPDDGTPIVTVDLQAVHSLRTETIAWRDLLDDSRWTIGWT
ncbi:MAG: TIGR02450 family Trp-rich protein [Herminiimonas sp.]|nr:TIGR02450 family Trp-rich protein [Herminiimonas sp.]